jgi:hypothetical protein
MNETISCAQCGSSDMSWRIKRAAGVRAGRSERSILWTCRSCGAGFEEPLADPGGEELFDDRPGRAEPARE